ncbi:unnamed protein product [Adineta steineri]|uniref:Carrier domain-containing protein n=2 Tax=Adineta steineri TaxID=433720 RepID=A0A814MRZ0_9BILA|nr:unnamed protein product [Adineta steineri]
MFRTKKSTAATTDHKVQRLKISGRTEAVASSAQQRIYMHENLYFSGSDISMYNIMVPLQIKRGSVSIEHIRSSLVSMIQQHTVLRTAIRFNPMNNQIKQNILPLTDDIYSFEHSRGVSTLEQLDHLLTNETIGKYFDIENGKVLRCHVVQRSPETYDDLLHESDLIIFVIHHIAFDLSSFKPFLKAFERACWPNAYQQPVLTIPQYIDFSFYEQTLLADTSAESKMNKARRFWVNLMHGYDWDKIQNLVPNKGQNGRHHSGRGYTTAFTIDQDVVDAMMLFASTNNVTMFSLSLACYYAFLFKLTSHDDDLCIVSSATNRYEKETQDMIGIFVNLLLYRIKIESNTTFKHLVQQVQQLSNEILVHASLSYQQIIDSQGKRENNVLPSAFFQYEPLKLAVAQKNSIGLTLSEGSVISGYYDRDLNHRSGISLFDISLTIIHDNHTPSTECFLNCSADIFKHQDDVDLLSKRFQHTLTQLFSFPMLQESIHEITILLPNKQISLSESNNTHLFSSDSSACSIPGSSTINHQMSMTSASMFWLDALHDCKLDQSLSLPYDRYRLTNEHRTCHTTSISFDFGQHLSHDFLIHASSNNISLEHLTFAIYFIFLFKLTNGQTDLCLALNINNNRYRDELKSIIGLFENVLPLRCQLDSQWCLHQVLEYIRDIITNSMKYSYFPLQSILNQHPHISKHAFLDTSLEFISYKNNNTVMIGDSQLVPGSSSFNINEDEILSVFDFSLSIHHDINMNQLSCTINASLDLFKRETVEKISQRFHFILHQLSESIIDSQINKPIYELSLALSNERYLMQSMNNTQISFPSARTCIHHEFVYQVMKHPQKLAVELDEQSLTYCELLYYVQILSLTLLNEYHVVPGEIVCQCVERSLSMVIGIMGIEMAGGVYCPLSPRDPRQRLQALIQQIQSRLVLVHNLTKTKFDDDIVALDIDSMLIFNDLSNGIDYNCLSSVIVECEEIAYIIFTSGSTGIPKAIQARHENFIHFMNSLVRIDVLNKHDIVVQIARCSFDIHVQEILGALMHGATLVMVHPGGTLDFDYLSNIVQMKQITYILLVPSLLQSFFTLIEQSRKTTTSKYFRSLCTGGEPFSAKLGTLITNNSVSEYNVWNYYGPAEITISCTLHLIDIKANSRSIPIGRSLPNYQCLILNTFLQCTSINQEGELFVGGMGVFSGYYGRDDLTAKALIEINDELFYQTGDLVRMDSEGLLYFIGRNDHQVKLRGQRIELGEIERCLFNITSISACVVVKGNDDNLVAYVQSSDIDEKQLHQHCQSHLPPHMIPSIFIILEKLPLNPNGKVDRKQLPSPHFSSTHLTNSLELLLPTSDIEVSIHRIWCEIFRQNQIPTDTNIFTIGGHSLLIMQLFHQYKIEFHLETNTLSISSLFQHPTIIDHAQLIQRSINSIRTLDDYSWSSLHLIQAGASFAQERIYLDEQIRFSSNKTTMKNMYVIPLLYRISSMNDHISITRLHHAVRSVIIKHNILRTALYLDTNSNIIQRCLDINIILDDHSESRGLTIINLHNDDHPHMNETIEKILNQVDLFDLSKGGVIRCHILRHYHQSQDNVSCDNDDLLTENDHILISIHHAMFDGASRSIFIRDLSLAYQTDDSLSIDDNSLQYIDYSTHEHIMDMTLSQEFWLLELKEYNLTNQLSLPVNRQRSSTNQQRSGLASIAQISFDNELCTSFLNYASSHHLTPFQLGLSIFYVFLFKLTHGETDLCISSINANRYRSELVNMIGMFVSTLPYRIQLDPHWSFDEVVKYVRKKCLSILEHSHYPLQHILGDNRSSQSNVSFLEKMFDFIIVSKDISHICLNDANLEQVSLEQSAEVSKFDFSLTFVYNPLSDNKRLSCRFVCSHDLFEKSTISKIAQRFQYMFEQVFRTKSSNTPMITISPSINKLSLIVAEEAEEMDTYETQEQLNEILHDERRNPHLFDLAQGLVFRCHLVYYKQISSNHLLSHKDLLLFNFHHAQFDFPSMTIFLHDLNQAYTTDQLLYDDNTNLRYLDYAVIEQQMTMLEASMFWLDTLYDCKLDQSLSLPYDRYCLTNEHRTCHTTSISFDFGQHLSHDFLIHASSNNISLEHLT